MIPTQLKVKVPFVDFSWQHRPIQKEIESAIDDVIATGDFVLGEALANFEVAFARACGVNWGVGVSSGTNAIALGLKACGVGVGDEVLVPANTFIASVIGVIETGAIPVLVDCDPSTALIDLESAARAITKKTRAILSVHLYGQMVSPQLLLDFARSYNLIIFEDAAQAHLANREGYIAGGVGTAAAFSFYPSKNLGAFGNGGMVVTKDEEIARKVRSLRNYGAPRKYYHTDIGTNSRLDTLQAAILNIKLPHLSAWNYQRNQSSEYYNYCWRSLNNQSGFPLINQTGKGHVYHLYVIQLNESIYGDRERIQKKLANYGIETGIHYPIPCHLQPAYQYLGYQKGDFPYAEMLCDRILSLPMYPGLNNSQIEYVCEQFYLVASERLI